MIPVYKIDSMYWLFVGLAVVLILDAAFLWLAAVRMSDISKRIENGELVTDGVYALVRHPIYSAWLQISIAIILFSQNIYLFILPIIFWIILSIALARTEEKWLTDKFGNDYVLYAQTTNRFVPFSRLR
jgi:protein-S-isoprenylcysteine O-methyltransferase Ste14